MLASSAVIRGEESDWAFEPKLDGWRATVTIVAGRLVVRTRNGHNVTAAVPELEPLARHFFGRSVVGGPSILTDFGEEFVGLTMWRIVV